MSTSECVKTPKALPSPAYLRERLRYEPETGKLYWRAHPSMARHWNSRHAGSEAFTPISSSGYLVGSIDCVKCQAHRVIWAMEKGAWPSDAIDHIDHNRLNNRLENLRVVNRVEQGRNMTRSRANTSGVTGVCWNRRERKWIAVIRVNWRRITLGAFKDFAAAVAVRKAAEIEHGFHVNHGAAR